MLNADEYIDKTDAYELLLQAFASGSVEPGEFSTRYRAQYAKDAIAWEATRFPMLRELDLQLGFAAGEPCPWGDAPKGEKELKKLAEQALNQIREGHTLRELATWVRKHLISSDPAYPIFEIYSDFSNRKSKLGKETVLYSARIPDSFVLAVIEGNVTPAPFKYADLMKAVMSATNEQPCYWVYITEPDNALAVVEQLRPHRWEALYSQYYQLEAFEKNPAAEGGCSYMCLLPEDKSWLLVHELIPMDSFTISLHSDENFSERVLGMLGVQASADVR